MLPVLLNAVRTSVMAAPSLLKVPWLVNNAPAPVSPAPWLLAKMKLLAVAVALLFQMPPAAFVTVPLPASALPARREFMSTLALVCVSVPSLRKIRPPSSRRPVPLMVPVPCTVVVAVPEWPPSVMLKASVGPSVRFAPVTWPKFCKKVPVPPMVCAWVKLTKLSPLICSVPAMVVPAVLMVWVTVPLLAKSRIAPLATLIVPLCVSAPPVPNCNWPACTLMLPVLLNAVRTSVMAAPSLLKVPWLVNTAPAPVSPAPWLLAKMKLLAVAVALLFQMPPTAFVTVPLPASALPARREFMSTLALVCVSVPSLRKIRPPSRRKPVPLMVVLPCTVVVALPE